MIAKHVAEQVLDALDPGFVEHRIERNPRIRFDELPIDFGSVQRRRTRELDACDPNPLFEPENDMFADDAVVVRLIRHVDRDVLEKTSGPQPSHIVSNRVCVEGYPIAFRRPAWRRVEVIAVSLR